MTITKRDNKRFCFTFLRRFSSDKIQNTITKVLNSPKRLIKQDNVEDLDIVNQPNEIKS